MIIIRAKRRRVEAVVLRDFPLADRIDYKQVKGLEQEEKFYDPKENERIRKTHPFERKEYGRSDQPSVIRWMWHPETGEMLVDAGAGVMHAIMHSNYARGLKPKQREPRHTMQGFDEWLRGFYFPQTRELAIRPYFIENLFPKSQFAIRNEEDEARYREAAQDFADRMQRHVKEMIEKEVGRKIKKFHMNVDNAYMAEKFRDQGGERW